MNRPFTYVNMAVTADGKITSSSREYPRFTSEADRRNMDRLRAEADAVLVGAGTLRADDPPMQVRDAGALAHRRSLGKTDWLLNVVVTASAKLDPDAEFFRRGSAETRLVATTEDAPESRLRNLAGRAEVWRLGTREVDLERLVGRLRVERGVDRLLVEGGGELNWRFLASGLIDELHVTIAPALLGGRDAPTLLEGTGLIMADQVRLKLVAVRQEADELFCHYEILRE